MKKTKIIVSLATLGASVLTPVITLASCGNKSTTTYKAIPESMLNIEGNILLGFNETAVLDEYDTLVIPQDIVAIADGAFKDAFVEDSNSSTIKSVIFNKNLRSIGSSAFENCSALTYLDFSSMTDIKLMSLILGGATTFASCSNKSGVIELPDGITDMQLEIIKTQFENAGLPGSWFGDKEAPDQETVDAINTILDEQTTACSTMSDLIDYVYAQSLATTGTAINLEELQATNANEQYVWDAKKNKVIEIDQNGNLTCGPKDYKLEAKPINIWKMVKPKSTSKVLKAFASNDAIYADEFSETTTYSQYLRTEYKQTWEATKSFSFQSGFDTGNVEKLELTYTKPDVEAGDTPVINTMKSSLTIEGSLDSIDHYGNLTELTVESLGTAETYSEYGSVDAAIVIKGSASISLEETAEVNEVIVDTTDINQVAINVESGSDVGTIGTADPNQLTQIESRVSGEGKEETTIKTTETTSTPDPTARFYSGDGTENAPYTIKTPAQLKNFADEVANKSSGQKQYFNLVADIDMSNEGNWTPVGTKAKPFEGIFNGCGFTISGLNISHNDPDNETAGYGLFGYTDGEVNSNFSSRDSIWSSSNELIEENISEDKYKTVIKNLYLDSINYQLLGLERCAGGIVGVAQNTYLYNCQVKTGSITGYKTIGGICGSVAGSVLKLCEAGADEGSLTIHARSYNVGGMFGRTEDKASYSATSIAMIKCATGSNCTISMDAFEGGGFIGGFTAYAEYQKTLAIEGSVNAATVECKGTYEDSEIAGFTGHGNHVSLIANCINSGYIKVTDSARVKNAAGIIPSPGMEAKLYNCVNSGKIVANAVNSVAGIAAGCTTGGLPTHVEDQMFEISMCSNTSTTISNPLDETKKADICDGVVGLTISDTTFANVQEVNDLISHTSATTTQITFKNCTLTDPSGSLTLPSNISTVYADKSICENITVNSNFSKINVYIPNQNITVTENSDCVLYAYGANNKITIEEGASVKSVYALGEGSEIVNNGTVKRTIGLDNTAKKATNNGTCANIRFGRCENYYQYVASTEMTFINNGTITGLADPSESVNDVITIYQGLTSSPLITIKNYGTIKYQNNGLSTPAKLISFTRHEYGYTLGGNLQLECYENSKIISDCQNFFQTTGGDDSRSKALLKWKEGYKVYEDGGTTPTTFADIKTYYENAGATLKISVEQMQ